MNWHRRSSPSTHINITTTIPSYITPDSESSFLSKATYDSSLKSRGIDSSRLMVKRAIESATTPNRLFVLIPRLLPTVRWGAEESTAVDQPSSSIWFIHFGEDRGVKSQATDIHREFASSTGRWRAMGSTTVERLPLEDKKGSGERDDEWLDGLDAVLCPWFCCSRSSMVKWWSRGWWEMRTCVADRWWQQIKQNSTMLLFRPPSNPRSLRRQLPSYLLIIHL